MDEATMKNPYVSGQRQLILLLGFNVDSGFYLLDCVCQLSTTLHLYNAMRTVGVIGQLQILEVLIAAVSDKVFFANRPRANFRKHFFHALGLDASMKSKRKDIPALSGAASAAYRIVCEGGFVDNTLSTVLSQVREAFASDELLSTDLVALSAELTRYLTLLFPSGFLLTLLSFFPSSCLLNLSLLELLVEASGLQDFVELRSEGNPRSKWPFLLDALSTSLLHLCERLVAEDVPHVAPPGGLTDMEPVEDLEDFSPLQPHEEARLAEAAKTMTDWVKELKVKNWK